MLRSMNSPPDPHEDHLRHLLDQRATRADLHSRVPSLSEFSDTPSIYSHPFFSPQPPHREADTSSLASQSLSRSSPRSGRERNRLNELAVSMLDLDEDPRSSFASSSVYNDEDQNDYNENDEDDEPMPRMSLLGPKMRFHSKAPWELDEGPVMEDEVGSDKCPDQLKSTFSPVQPLDTRKPSFESRRSQGKSSFESASSQMSYSRGPLHALTHSSTSSGSLASPRSGPRSPFSISRVRSHSPSLAQPPLLLPTSSCSPPESYISSMHDVGQLDTNSSRVRSRPSYSSNEDDAHPYSNPNHARSASEQSYDTSEVLPHLAFPAVPRSDSSATVTEVQYGKVLCRPDTPQPETPVLPALHSPRSTIQRKEISSPISVQSMTIRPGDISLPSDPSNLLGWTDRGAPPAFGLISLEEARAQRARTIAAQAAASTPSSTDPAFHFPTKENVNDHSPTSSVTARARARSVSAGTRAKQAFSNIVSGTPVKVERRDSEPAVVLHSTNSSGSSPGGKGLKHKKSGFMRLFNGGKDDKSPPPPVPSLSDGYAAFNAQQSTQKSVKVPIHRIPVPTLSSSLTDFTKSSSSVKRTHPPLSIKTSSPAAISRPTPSSAAGPHFPLKLGIPNESPQSAPANVTEFPALKLRPISTMFSAQFGDHLIPSSSLTSPDADTPSSASPSTAVSPTTPVSFSRLSDKPVVMDAGDDQSSVIRALQDQIVSAKKAWQRHIWELEGQIKDLKEEVESHHTNDNDEYCSSCGRGRRRRADESHPTDGESKSVSINRSRDRTGRGTSRFGRAV
ncbi:uncharacterized protein BT62DRAFT_527885 [Guyanagaster necrorhizus]|uniref:Uncharacterized protein n=1 Tax=Guyanagaster necrorhizus TaxID=856835 RepID=A0A9P7W3K4_9AGAR|nr:uncharacterized protein BT62DRAFT_527885 [Guyanagaster necrorhizus MCA 3950]KAG7450656.1 hypothetical protein BT62DRAFT_527885 [Guyanagaster necrorhizus MCA 3950]